MAYFRRNEPENLAPDDGGEVEYDDGFDALEDEAAEEEEPLTPEESERKQKHRLALAYGAGNTTALVIGIELILLLIALLLSMIRFVQTDMSRNFTLFETRF